MEIQRSWEVFRQLTVNFCAYFHLRSEMKNCWMGLVFGLLAGWLAGYWFYPLIIENKEEKLGCFYSFHSVVRCGRNMMSFTCDILSLSCSYSLSSVGWSTEDIGWRCRVFNNQHEDGSWKHVIQWDFVRQQSCFFWFIPALSLYKIEYNGLNTYFKYRIYQCILNKSSI